MNAWSIAQRVRLGAALLVTSGWLLSSLLLVVPGTAKAQGITLTIAGGTGAPGGTAEVTLTLSGDDQNQAIGVSDFVTFDDVLSVANSDCALDPRITPGTHIKSVLPQCIPGPPAGKKCVNFDIAVNPALADPNQPLGNGPLMTCVFHIAEGAPVGPLALTGSQSGLEVGDKDLNLLPATVVSGQVQVDVSSATPSPTPTATGTETQTPTPSLTATPSATATLTETASPSPTQTAPPSATATQTTTPTLTPTQTHTQTASPTLTQTRTLTPTSTQTSTSTPTSTQTSTSTPTRTSTSTPTQTATRVPCASDPDCPPGEICLNQICSVEHCTTSADCSGGRQCVSGICQQLPTPTLTPTKTATAQPTATSTAHSGGGGGGGCNMTPGVSADTSILWLLIPAALVAWRRQARK